MAATSSEAVAVEEPSTSQPLEEPPLKSPDTSSDVEKKDVSAIDQLEIQSEPLEFVGLGKEELLILANRPFWVRLRWALFITFWLMWLGLLVGAALIIALSPGCENGGDEVKVASTGNHR